MRRQNVENLNKTKSKLIANKVCVYFHVLGMLMMNRIGPEVDYIHIITIQMASLGRGQQSSARSWQSQVVPATTLATARYSALVLEREVVAYQEPGDKSRANEHTITRGRTSHVMATSPIGV